MRLRYCTKLNMSPQFFFVMYSVPYDTDFMKRYGDMVHVIS